MKGSTTAGLATIAPPVCKKRNRRFHENQGLPCRRTRLGSMYSAWELPAAPRELSTLRPPGAWVGARHRERACEAQMETNLFGVIRCQKADPTDGWGCRQFFGRRFSWILCLCLSGENGREGSRNGDAFLFWTLRRVSPLRERHVAWQARQERAHCQACLPFMRAQKSGKIINISSVGGVYGTSGAFIHGTRPSYQRGAAKVLPLPTKGHPPIKVNPWKVAFG